MKTRIKLIVPIYYHLKKDIILVGVNKYLRLHHTDRSKINKFYYNLVKAKVSKSKKIKKEYRVHYVLYYKNVQCDAPNIVHSIDKIVMDGLQLNKNIVNDNVRHYLGASWEVAGQDKINPRLEIYIEEQDDKDTKNKNEK